MDSIDRISYICLAWIGFLTLICLGIGAAGLFLIRNNLVAVLGFIAGSGGIAVLLLLWKAMRK